jgi:hypothetical protein
MELEVTPEDLLIVTHNQPFVEKYGEIEFDHAQSMLDNIKLNNEKFLTLEINKEFLKLIEAYKKIWKTGLAGSIQDLYFPNCIICGQKSIDLFGAQFGITISLCDEHRRDWKDALKGHLFGSTNGEKDAEVSRDIARSILKKNNVKIAGLEPLKKETNEEIKREIAPVEKKKRDIVSEMRYMNIKEHFVMCALDELNRPYFRKW